MSRSQGFAASTRTPIVREYLARDGSLRTICGVERSPTTDPYDAGSTTIDHAVPLRDGGEIERYSTMSERFAQKKCTR